ncbi:hypothetical protein XFF6994_2300003 [Xanthomonas citri pv. fuscans]|nr:hypothetical protein XFF6994_2300003 [Xanthomonas citri pv. fuscans]
MDYLTALILGKCVPPTAKYCRRVVLTKAPLFSKHFYFSTRQHAVDNFLSVSIKKCVSFRLERQHYFFSTQIALRKLNTLHVNLIVAILDSFATSASLQPAFLTSWTNVRHDGRPIKDEKKLRRPDPLHLD